MMIQKTLHYLEKSLTAYHASDEAQRLLLDAHFTPLYIHEDWMLKAGGRYSLSLTNGISLAFVLPEHAPKGFHIIGTHNDSPALRLKPNPELRTSGYTTLNTEVYGGPLLTTWFDRPLHIAGQIYTTSNDWHQPTPHTITLPQTITLPSLAAHMRRESGDIQPQKELHPIWGDASASSVTAAIAAHYKLEEQAILSSELYLVSAEKPLQLGEFYQSPRIDNLSNAICAIEALKAAEPTRYIALWISNHHEEIGSRSPEGAAGAFLQMVLQKIATSLRQELTTLKQASFMLSCDQAHGVHPNYPEKADPQNKPLLNHGPVLKQSASHSYATSALGAAMLTQLCRQTDLPLQQYVNRSDLRGGSTIGPISEIAVGIPAIDIGSAMLAMHASSEFAGIKDQDYMYQLMKAFLEG